MKPRSPKPSAKPTRRANDNLCKRPAEEYPEQFAEWLFGVTRKVKVEKTELSREPIRADSVIFSANPDETLHTEFQTTMKGRVPVPLRMLDYYVGLKRHNPARRVRQVLVVLTPGSEPTLDRYEDENTLHRYQVVEVWKQDPAVLLPYEGLIPLATLCETELGEALLEQVAARINHISLREQRLDTLNMSRVLAGLRYDRNVVYKILKESDMLEESTVYQDILRKGERKGVARGKKILVLQQLTAKVGRLPLNLRQHVEQLAPRQIEALSVALLKFDTRDDLIRWLAKHAPAN